MQGIARDVCGVVFADHVQSILLFVGFKSHAPVKVPNAGNTACCLRNQNMGHEYLDGPWPASAKWDADGSQARSLSNYSRARAAIKTVRKV